MITAGTTKRTEFMKLPFSPEQSTPVQAVPQALAQASKVMLPGSDSRLPARISSSVLMRGGHHHEQRHQVVQREQHQQRVDDDAADGVRARGLAAFELSHGGACAARSTSAAPARR